MRKSARGLLILALWPLVTLAAFKHALLEDHHVKKEEKREGEGGFVVSLRKPTKAMSANLMGGNNK